MLVAFCVICASVTAGALAGLLAFSTVLTADTRSALATPFCEARVAGVVPALCAAFSSAVVMPSVLAIAAPTLARTWSLPRRGPWLPSARVLVTRWVTFSVSCASDSTGAPAGLLAFIALTMVLTRSAWLTPLVAATCASV